MDKTEPIFSTCYSQCCFRNKYLCPPCYFCGQYGSIVCASQLCQIPPYSCRGQCINRLSTTLHEHKGKKYDTRYLEMKIQNIEDGINTDFHKEYLEVIKERLVAMKSLFKQAFQSHQKKITTGFKLKSRQECQEFIKRFKAREFEATTGKQVAMLLGDGGVIYENKESADKIIRHEKNRFESMMTAIQSMLQQYISSDSIRQCQEKGEDLLHKGIRLMEERKCEEAIEKYLQAERFLIENEEVFLLAGNCFKQIEKYKQAKAQYQQCIRINSHNTQALQNIAEVCDIQKEYSESIEHYTTLIQINKKQSQYYFKRGQAHTQTNQLKDALLDYSKACQLESGNELYHEHKRKTMLKLAYLDDSEEQH